MNIFRRVCQGPSCVLKYIFLVGVFILPLVFWSKAEIPYEIPKVWFFCRWVEILAILGALRIRKEKSVIRKNNQALMLLVLVFMLTAFLTSVLGVDFNKSFWGNYYRQDGLVTFFHLTTLFFFLSLFWEKSWERPTFLAISLGCLLTSVWAVFMGIRFHLLKDLNVYAFGKAIGATFGQPNFLAGYLLVCLPFLTGLASRAKSRYERNFWLTALVFQMLAIGLTFSWAGILGIVIFGVLYLVLPKFKFNQRSLLMNIFIVLCLALAILFIWKPGRFDEHYPESRTRIIGRGIIAFTKRPIFGWGWANFDYAFEAIDWPMKFVPDIYVDKAHSHLLETLVNTGLMGFALYLAIIVLVLKLIRPQKTWLLAFLLFLFHSQTNVISINEELIFWLIIGIAGSG